MTTLQAFDVKVTMREVTHPLHSLPALTSSCDQVFKRLKSPFDVMRNQREQATLFAVAGPRTELVVAAAGVVYSESCSNLLSRSWRASERLNHQPESSSR